MSREDLFAPRSPLFASHALLFEPHSPAFEPPEGEGKRRELPFERREDLFVSHSPAFEPPDRLFASHSPELEWREEEGTPREEEGMPREEWGMRHFKLFARRSPHTAYNSLRGMSLDLSFTGLEERGMPRKLQVTSRKSIATTFPAPSASHREPTARRQAEAPFSDGRLAVQILCCKVSPLQHPFLWKLIEGR